MQQTRGEGHCGDEPTDVSGPPGSGIAEPVTLVDLDGAVTRIAPLGIWTREQVRHPSGHPLFITRLERGELWHRAEERHSTWAHEVQVGPATVVSEAGQFHAVAEVDGGATITCLEGQVAVATPNHEPMLLRPHQAVGVAADGETAIVVEAPAIASTAALRRERPVRPAARNGNGLARSMIDRSAMALRFQVVAALLVLVVILLVVLIVLLAIGRR